MDKRKALVFCFIILFISIASSYGQSTKELSIGWEPWEPFQYKNSNGILSGLDIEMANAVIENMDYIATFKEIPWKRLLIEIEKGTIDIISGASRTTEREEYAHFSNTYRTESMVLYIRKEDISKYSIKNLKDIIGTSFKLGVTRGYYYGEDYNELSNNPNFMKQVSETRADNRNYKMLILKRIDGFLSDPIVTTVGLKEEGIFDQVAILIPIFSSDIYFMFSKKSISPQIVAAFNNSLDELKNNGIYDEILDKYLK